MGSCKTEAATREIYIRILVVSKIFTSLFISRLYYKKDSELLHKWDIIGCNKKIKGICELL